jgi:hypothetical protein
MAILRKNRKEFIGRFGRLNGAVKIKKFQPPKQLFVGIFCGEFLIKRLNYSGYSHCTEVQISKSQKIKSNWF